MLLRSQVLTALLLAGGLTPLGGQAPNGRLPTDRLVTLASWAEDLWMTVLDRDGAYFGRLADQGILQRFHPLMDDEYELDLWAGWFSPWEDARWSLASRGFRAAGASVNHPYLLTFADWRFATPIGGPTDFLATYTRQGTLTAQRDFATVGVRWRDLLGSGFAARFGLGVHFFKPSTDLEFGLAREWANARGQPWRVDLRLALLDAFSNFVFNELGVAPEEAEAHFDHTATPVAVRVAASGSAGRVRFELEAGATNRPGVEVTFPASGARGYLLRERVAFAGALVEARPSGGIALAAYATVARAATDRRAEPDAGRDLRVRELSRAAGLSGWLSGPGGIGIEADLRVRWRPEDRRENLEAAVRHDDREVMIHLALARRPAVAGWQWRLGYTSMDRDAGLLAPQLTAVNHRNLMEAGYRFVSGFELAGGVRWDLDHLGAGAFDGGHLRLQVVW